MKKLLVIVLCFIFSGCDYSENTETLVGEWELLAINIDPGDGSGEFEQASYAWRLEFMPDGIVHSHLGNCHDKTNDGIYTEDEIKGLSCFPDYSYHIQGRYLILSEQYCFEGCSYKFTKVNSSEDW